MQELYSKDEDCFELYKILKSKMGNKIEYYGTPYISPFSGKYFSHINSYYTYKKGLPFYYKYSKNEFLRIQVGSSIYYNTSIGERLAALSDFYIVLSEIFGEPTVFYTIKDDDEKLLSLQWSFINKEEEINNFKNGTYFIDAVVDKLIIFNEQKSLNINELTKTHISHQLGLPLELIELMNKNIEDYLKYKENISEQETYKKLLLK